MNSYAIDQNVIYDAWRGKRLDRTEAIPERRFVYGFFYSKHALVVNNTLIGKISKMGKQSIEDEQYVDNMIVPLFVKLVFSSNRIKYANDVPVEFEGGKKCDKHYVSVTLQTKGLLVTNDQKLKDAVKKDAKVSNCTCMDIHEAIDSL